MLRNPLDPDLAPARQASSAPGGAWRPAQRIRVVAIGLHWRDGRLLAVEVRDDDGRLKGVRPPGGGVEFGEDWRGALAREWREEFGVEAQIGEQVAVLENIFQHEGALGHEIVFVADVTFPEGAMGEAEVVAFTEDDGAPCLARWFALDAFETDGLALYPTGLKQVLLARAKR